MDLPREAIGPKGSNCFSRGVLTGLSKETYSNVIFQGGSSVFVKRRQPAKIATYWLL